MASSTHNQPRHHLPPSAYSTTSAPPPTPSSQPDHLHHHHHTSSSATIDALSRLLHRPPPTLSLPTRRSSSVSTTSPPLISFSNQTSIHDHLLSASSQLGFFQLTHHNIPSLLANSAESEGLSLFQLSKDKKETYFPKNWPFGFEEDDESGNGESFWLDSACSTSTESTTELGLSSLRGLAQGLEKLGLEIIQLLSSAVGFDNPFKKDPNRVCSLMLVHEGLYGDKPDHISGGFYPYVVGLQYEIRSQKYSLLADSGWVAIVPQVDSVLVTIGDIAHVWSNGKLKKVRGRALPCMGDGKNSSPRSISMTLLLTLPTETTVSPLLPKLGNENEVEHEEEEEDEALKKDDEEIDNGNNINIVEKQKRLFSSFSFEDYAWRVYHEPLIFKDPLDKYRTSR